MPLPEDSVGPSSLPVVGREPRAITPPPRAVATVWVWLWVALCGALVAAVLVTWVSTTRTGSTLGLGLGSVTASTRGAATTTGRTAGKRSGTAMNPAMTALCTASEPATSQRVRPMRFSVDNESIRLFSNMPHLAFVFLVTAWKCGVCAQAARNAYPGLDTVGGRLVPACANGILSHVPSSLTSLPVTRSRRVLSVDILRGATVALMILVNDPGDPACVYGPLGHADWNGYTAADLVFPNFLFLSGASLVFSLESKIRNPAVARGELVRGLLKRTLNLMALKLFVAHAPTFRVRRIRIFGVLFRSSLLGLVGGLTLLATLEIPVLLGISAALLAVYYGLLRIPFGGLNRPLLDPDNNLAAALDRRIANFFHGHLHSGALWNVTHDPEGLLSSAPALATVLLGAVAALHMRDEGYTRGAKARHLAAAGVAALALGHAWDRSFPVNKNLWTSSYVLVSGGWSLLALAGLYWLYDVEDGMRNPVVKALTRPLQIFGANALPVYVLSLLGHKTGRMLQVRRGEHRVSVRTAVYRGVFARGGSSRLRSLAFAVSYAGLCFLPNLWLWRRKTFIRI